MATTTTKGRRGRKPAQNETAAMLTTALNFLSIVPDKATAPNAVVFNGPLAYVNNGMLKAGTTIGGDFPADIVAKVNMSSLAGALALVGKEMQIAFGDDVIAIEAGGFTGDLANIGLNMSVDRASPDPQIAPLNNAFRDAIVKVARLASDTADELMVASIALLGGTVMATKRHTIIEAWHGNDMPGGIFVPKAFATALGKTKTDLRGFGFSATSFTVFFMDNSFLQTNTYPDAWNIPDTEPGFVIAKAYELLADAEGTVIEYHDQMTLDMKAIAAVTNADISVTLGRMASVDGQAVLATKDMSVPFVIDPSRYLAIADLVKTLKIVTSTPSRLLFWGDAVRGAVIVDTSIAEPTQQAPGWGGATPAEPEPEAPATRAWVAPEPPAAVAEPAAPAPVSGWGVPPAVPPASLPVFPPSSGGAFGDDDE